MTVEFPDKDDLHPDSEEFFHPNREYVVIDTDGQTILYDSVEDNPDNQVIHEEDAND